MIRARTQDRVAAGIGTVAIVAALGWMLVAGLHVDVARVVEHPLALLDLRSPPPPVRPPEQHRQARLAARPPSPPNLRRQAAEIVTPPPPPVVLPPPPPPVVTARRAGSGMAASAGNADRSGPGYGAGGAGNGSGGGGDGGDGDDTPPEQIKGRLSYSDLPADLREQGAGGGVDVRYAVGVDGRVSNCTASHVHGPAELGPLVCALIEKRFRFEPSRDSDGHPVRSTVVETHSWEVDRRDEGG